MQLGPFQQREEQVADRVGGVVGARGEQQAKEREDLLVVERAALELAVHQRADEVVAGLGAALLP